MNKLMKVSYGFLVMLLGVSLIVFALYSPIPLAKTCSDETTSVSRWQEWLYTEITYEGTETKTILTEYFYSEEALQLKDRAWYLGFAMIVFGLILLIVERREGVLA